jgi:hypothetical protein
MTLGKSGDEQRLAHLFHYLSACLAWQQKPGGEANATAIATRLGDSSLRRILGSLLASDSTWEARQADLGKLSKATTGTIIQMLQALTESLQEEYQQHGVPYIRVLTPDDVLTVLYKLIELTPDERQALGLPATDGLTLLKRALLILQTTGDCENHETLFQVYKVAIGLSFRDSNAPLETLEQVDELVSEVVAQALDHLPYRAGKPGNRMSGMAQPGKEETIRTLTRKAQRQIRRFLTRSGTQINPITNNEVVINSYIRKYLLPAFISKLAQTVVANERLTDQFPVYLKRVAIQPYGPLPFADQELDGLQQFDAPYPPLLHPALRRIDLRSLKSLQLSPSALPGPSDYELANQEAVEVIAEFYVKVPGDYEPVVGSTFTELASQNKRRIDFSLRSIGIGGTLSHVVKVINSALLWDIPCLNDYFPIGHDITSTQTIVQDNVASPVWAHSLVKLCLKKTVAQTLQTNHQTRLGAYEEFAFADPIGHGDYCGFDSVISQAHSALQARLQAIRNSGVQPTTYIRHLCERIELSTTLEDAYNRCRGYPFSTLAMVSLIQEKILSSSLDAAPLKKTDSYIYFEACVSIVEALLEEGLYRSAFRYLKRLQVLNELVNKESAITQAEANQFEIFSSALIIRYLLCLANYYYLYDTAESSTYYLPPNCPNNVNREGLVQRAWETLKRAEIHIRIRMQKYVVINEVSQGILSPHCSLTAKIVFLKAKLMLFYPRLVPLASGGLPTDNQLSQERAEASIHWGRLYLTEKARLYAAADGEGEAYACYAAMQCWVYLLAAYAGPDALNLRPHLADSAPNLGALSTEDCLKWARKLRDHALISYADAGRKYYYQIKEKSGHPKENLDKFGTYFIQPIPAIFEFRGGHQHSESRSFENLLALDMSLFAVRPEELPKLSPNHPKGLIYLFGSNACYLFFARGLCVLCDNEAQEFDATESASEINWQAKLLHAIRLFNLTWSIAEDGCSMQVKKHGKQRSFIINRSLNNEGEDNDFLSGASPEVQSVRSLYPRRINELADLGKVFAAASMVLCASTMSPEHRAELNQDAEMLLSRLHTNQLSQRSRVLKAMVARQARYNGHLSDYFQPVREMILAYCDQKGDRSSDRQGRSIRQRRDSLVKSLFGLLHNRPYR